MSGISCQNINFHGRGLLLFFHFFKVHLVQIFYMSAQNSSAKDKKIKMCV
jgi:hypothetical protein